MTPGPQTSSHPRPKKLLKSDFVFITPTVMPKMFVFVDGSCKRCGGSFWQNELGDIECLLCGKAP